MCAVRSLSGQRDMTLKRDNPILIPIVHSTIKSLGIFLRAQQFFFGNLFLHTSLLPNPTPIISEMFRAYDTKK